MMRTCALLSLAGGALAQGPLPPAGVSTQYLIPYVYDVELELEYNSHTFSGIADTYLQGSLHSSHTHESTTKFELVTTPKLGSIGWNNTLAGKFVYSPVEVSLGVLGNYSEAKDSFIYRAVNEYGQSNWGTVVIQFKAKDKADGMLKIILFLAGAGVFFSFAGLIRVVCLQAILNPGLKFQGTPFRQLACFCDPGEDTSEGPKAKSASDIGNSMYFDDGEYDNPLAEGEGLDNFVDDTDEFT